MEQEKFDKKEFENAVEKIYDTSVEGNDYEFNNLYKARFLASTDPKEAMNIIIKALNEIEDVDLLIKFKELGIEISKSFPLSKKTIDIGYKCFSLLNKTSLRIEDAKKLIRREDVIFEDKMIKTFKLIIGSEDPYFEGQFAKLLKKTTDYSGMFDGIVEKNEYYQNIIVKFKRKLQNNYNKSKNYFLEIPQNNREVIFVSDYIYPIRADNLKIILKNDTPKDIIFPINHPQLNEIYTFHPFNDKSYLPIKEYETTLFVDKVNELQQLLQCLGATRVEIVSSKNNIEKRTANTKNKISVKGGYNGVEINGGYEKEEENSNFNKESLNIEGVQVFKPTKSPFLPENLNWYHSEISWQKLVNQRMSGNLLHHKFIIQSSQKSSISKSEAKKINAEIKVIFAKGGFEYSNEESIETTKKENIEFIVDVTFEDKELLKVEHKKKLSFLTDGTDEYENEVKFMLEDDGKIDKNERSILNRKMKKLNISIEQAKEIETKVLNSNYSIEELKYIEEIKDFIKEGDITDTVKNMLDRYAKKFSISKKSQKEINLKFNIK